MKKIIIISILIIVILGIISIISTLNIHTVDNTTKASIDNVLDIKSCKQLFLNDDYLIENNSGFKATQNTPEKIGTLIDNTAAWEEDGILSGIVLPYNGVDGKKYSFFTIARWEGEPWRSMEVFTSNDGINWSRPILNKYNWKGSTANNIYGPKELGIPMWDDRTQTYRVMAGLAGGVNMQYSNNPLGPYTPSNRGEVNLPYYLDTQNQIYYDKKIGKYILYLRGWQPDAPVTRTSEDFGRTVIRVEVDINDLNGNYGELAAWTKFKGYVPTLNANELDSVLKSEGGNKDPYGPYFAPYDFANCDGIPAFYIMLPTMFHWPDATSTINLAISRNNKDWNYVDYNNPYIARSTQIGNNDAGTMYSVIGMVQNGNDLIQYYTASDAPKSHNAIDAKLLGLKQRMDGFISLDAGDTQAEIITKPFVFQGNSLILNSKPTKQNGKVNIEILDENNSPITNFTVANSLPISTDNIRNVVYWSKGADISKLIGRTIKLHMVATNSKIYGFQTDNIDLNVITADSSACNKYDLNSDGKVDISNDFLIFRSNYLKEGNGIKGDFNQDQIVDISDFIEFRASLYKFIETNTCK